METNKRKHIKRKTNVFNSAISCTKINIRHFAGEEEWVGAHSKLVNVFTNNLRWNRSPRKCLVTNACKIGEPTPRLRVNRRRRKGHGMGTLCRSRSLGRSHKREGIACTKPICLNILSKKYTSTISKQVIPSIKAMRGCSFNNALREGMYRVHSTCYRQN